MMERLFLVWMAGTGVGLLQIPLVKMVASHQGQKISVRSIIRTGVLSFFAVTMSAKTVIVFGTVMDKANDWHFLVFCSGLLVLIAATTTYSQVVGGHLTATAAYEQESWYRDPRTKHSLVVFLLAFGCCTALQYWYKGLVN